MFEREFEQILLNYRDALSVRSRFAGLVKDYMPGNPMQINLLINAYDLGIAQEIEKSPTINHAFAFRFVKRLVDEYGISRSNADWAVSMWCVCYGQNVLKKPCEIKLSTGQKGAAPSIQEEKPGMTQYGELFQYEKLSDNSGLAVTGFRGDNNRAIIFQNQYHNTPVVAIKEKAFMENTLEEAIITDGILRIEKQAFSGCSNLHQVIVPPTLKELGDSVFAGCASLRTIVLPESLEQIGAYAFSGTGLKAAQIPKSVYWLGEGVFSHCRNLSAFDIPANINIVPARLLQECDGIKKVNLHEQVIAIEDEAFSGCSNLMELYVPDTVQHIGMSVFDGVHDKFILLCGLGSYAERYAQTHKMKYQLV